MKWSTRFAARQHVGAGPSAAACVLASTAATARSAVLALPLRARWASAAGRSGLPSYESEFKASVQDPERYWASKAEKVHWHKRWDSVLDSSRPPFYRWFPGGKVNTCYNALDLHIAQGRGDQVALIWDSPVSKNLQKYTYKDLHQQVTHFAGVLANTHGVEKGDRVLIYMPMIPQAVIAMLACARIGAIHSVVFGGFAADQLAVRINHAKPKVTLSASCGIEPNYIVQYKPLLDRAIEMAKHKPHANIIYQRPGLETQAALVQTAEQKDYDWDQEMARSRPFSGCTELDSHDPLYVLYTSGTTGNPKGVVRDNAGHLVAIKNSMEMIYDLKPGEVFWAASDIGWVVGHSYIVYGPLLEGATTVLYEGKPVGTPDSGAYWRVISQHGVNVSFMAPTAVRAIRKEDPEGSNVAKYDMSNLRAFFLAGERADPATVHWAQKLLHHIPVIDHWWQTETGWAIGAKCLGLDYGAEPHVPANSSHVKVKPGSCGLAVPGYDVRVLDETTGRELPHNRHLGEVVVRSPLPPGCFPTLWPNDEEKYHSSYFHTYTGYYRCGDAGFVDSDGYIHIMARTDDVINVAGHRLSTGALEEVLSSHPDVAECAVIGAEDQLKGEVPVGFIVLKSGVTRDSEDVAKDCIKRVRERIGPVATFKVAIPVNRLPKTRSGKILRGTMKKIADGHAYQTPATIDDPAILDEIEAALLAKGYAKEREEP